MRPWGPPPMADKRHTSVKPHSGDKQEGVDKSKQVFNLPDEGKSKSEFGWPRNSPKWLRDNLRWISALALSVLAAYLFFTITDNDSPEDFIELVLALAVGGTVSAAVSFKVVGDGKAGRKSG